MRAPAHNPLSPTSCGTTRFQRASVVAGTAIHPAGHRPQIATSGYSRSRLRPDSPDRSLVRHPLSGFEWPRPRRPTNRGVLRRPRSIKSCAITSRPSAWGPESARGRRTDGWCAGADDRSAAPTCRRPRRPAPARPRRSRASPARRPPTVRPHRRRRSLPGLQAPRDSIPEKTRGSF